MIQSIFPNYFYSVITPPNKEELITTFINAEVNQKETKELIWPNACEIKVESLYHRTHYKGVGSVLAQTLRIFFLEMGVMEGDKDFDNMRLLSIWRNTYNKGYYQEIHDHLGPEGADLSGVVFLNDHVEGASEFYFYDKHYSEVTTSWRRLLQKVKAPNSNKLKICNPKAGDVLLFPSYIPHGVTMHEINQPRTTISFNIAF